MDITQLDSVVLYYCDLGIAPSTARTYRTAVTRFSAFCAKFRVVRPFPVDELLLCRFLAALAKEGLAPATLRTYLSGIRHAQITRGLPEPSRSGLPRLKLLQSGVARDRANRGGGPPRQRLPITPQLLGNILEAWAREATRSAHSKAMLSAAATLCFFGFFRSGELTVPSAGAFNESVHLAWGDVTASDTLPPSAVRVHL